MVPQSNANFCNFSKPQRTYGRIPLNPACKALGWETLVNASTCWSGSQFTMIDTPGFGDDLENEERTIDELVDVLKNKVTLNLGAIS